jgi:hypothetical protein
VTREDGRLDLRILARSPRMPEPLYAGNLARAARFYEVSRVVRTVHAEPPER